MVTRKIRHSWNLTPGAAIALQQRLRSKVVRTGAPAAGAHTSPGPTSASSAAAGSRAPRWRCFPSLQLELVDYAIARQPTRFPYVPGLLSFREMPALLAALDRLRVQPDLILCDGQGYAHPRRFGIACHLGVTCGIPTIGVAKSRLIGEHGEPMQRRGAWVPLRDRGETIGAVLRSRAHPQPVYVSIGHRVSLPLAVRYVMACTTEFRLPGDDALGAPTRLGPTDAEVTGR